MLIAVAQINCTVGDLQGNAAMILDYAERAKAMGAALLVTPELALSGYPPEDLLLRGGFNEACARTLAQLAQKIVGVTLVIGHPLEDNERIYNAASVVQDGKIVLTYCKHRLPNSTVFDEERYFEPGQDACVFELNGVRFGIVICEDLWVPGPASLARGRGAQVLLVPNASPYHTHKQKIRYEIAEARAKETGLALVYVNSVGGQDELVFDGASFAMNARGQVTHQFPEFKETLALLEIQDNDLLPGEIGPQLSLEASIYTALCVGVRDYIGKNAFPGVLLGLSGGIDSALTLCIACDALGADKVHAVMMPSYYTADMSNDNVARRPAGPSASSQCRATSTPDSAFVGPSIAPPLNRSRSASNSSRSARRKLYQRAGDPALPRCRARGQGGDHRAQIPRRPGRNPRRHRPPRRHPRPGRAGTEHETAQPPADVATGPRLAE